MGENTPIALFQERRIESKLDEVGATYEVGEGGGDIFTLDEVKEFSAASDCKEWDLEHSTYSLKLLLSNS